MRKRNLNLLISVLLIGGLAAWSGHVGAAQTQVAEATFYVS